MDVAKQQLIMEIEDTIARIEIQSRQVAKKAAELSETNGELVLACQVMDTHGNFMLTPLLVAKANAYLALAQIKSLPEE